jgi:ABC-type Fe3+/spermidine/putrescine transport system ATPase subunit
VDPDGTSKTTRFRMINGEDDPDEGHIAVGG